MANPEAGTRRRARETTSVAFAILDLGGPADAIAKVVKLGAPDFASPNDLYATDERRMQREAALDAYAVGHTADGVSGSDAGAAPLQHDAFENLKPLALAFTYLDVNADGVAGAKVGEVSFQRVLRD